MLTIHYGSAISRSSSTPLATHPAKHTARPLMLHGGSHHDVSTDLAAMAKPGGSPRMPGERDLAFEPRCLAHRA